MRRYGTLPGQAVECPSFRRLSDGRLLKPAHRSYSGAHHAQSNGNHRFARLLRVLRFTALASLALLLVGVPLAHVNVAVAIAALVLVSVDSLLYRVGRRRATSMLAAKTKGVLHTAIEVGRYVNVGVRSRVEWMLCIVILEPKREALNPALPRRRSTHIRSRPLEQSIAADAGVRLRERPPAPGTQVLLAGLRRPHARRGHPGQRPASRAKGK